MADKLVIVESPAKAKTIQKYLGPGFRVEASMGHVRDLPEKGIGVDVEHGFTPTYEVPDKKKKVVQDLKRRIQDAEAVYLATDPDREGEAIAWHITEATGIKRQKKPIFRVTFTEITRDAVRYAVDHPRQIDRNLVDAQQARRVLDRLVGYGLSDLLRHKVRFGTSAGRVQSVAVRLVVEREREIVAFKPVEYWTIEADLAPSEQKGKQQIFRAVLIERAGKKLDKFAIGNRAAADAIVADLNGAGYSVVKVTRKDKRRSPAPPFTTSTLQQEASRKLGFSAKRTMQVAQQLYEGVDIGGSEGTVGLITYMRTDSTSVSKDAQEEARHVIAERYGQEYLPEKAPIYKTKAKGAQEAHEAIRPTSSQRLPEHVSAKLDPAQRRLYDLIWKRFVASQMAPAIFDSTTVDIAATKGSESPSKPPYLFRATGSVLKFRGFLAVYNVDIDEGEEDEDREAVLPPLSEGELLKLIELLSLQHFTTPPPRFTEASLVKELERLGIGRPSTYAPTLATIQDRKYVEIIEKKLVPTSLGGVVTDVLIQYFPDIVDYGFTSEMEQRFDDIAEGQRKWAPVIGEFYDPFSQRLSSATKDMRSVKREEIRTDIACPTCGEVLLIKWGKNGEFLACSNAECKFTGDIKRNAEGQVTIAQGPQLSEQVSCPICSKPMAVKKSRFGPFLACSGYPECKGTRKLRQERDGRLVVVPEPKPTSELCPKCQRPMVQKEGRYGPFLSCTGYPQCRTIVRIQAEGAQGGVRCPDCGSGQIIPKRGKGGRTFWSCSRYPECKYASNKPPEPVAA